MNQRVRELTKDFEKPSLCLAPFGLTGVASAPTAHNPLGLGAISGANRKNARKRCLNAGSLMVGGFVPWHARVVQGA